MSRILVIGGSGFVGRHLVRQLVEDEHFVNVPTRSRERAKHLILLPTVDVVEADINDRTVLARLLRGAHAVINLVGVLHDSPRGAFERAHVALVRSVVDACRANGVQRLLHMSALGADVHGPSRYLTTKAEGEAVVAESGLAWTIFQ